MEMEKAHLNDDSKERPADVYIPEWMGTKDAWIDVAVVSPLGSAVWSSASWKRGHVALQKENDKKRRYLANAENKRAIFIPCVMEEFGGFGGEAVKFLKTLAHGYAGQRGCTVSEAVCRIMQRLSFESQRALAHSLQARLSDSQLA